MSVPPHTKRHGWHPEDALPTATLPSFGGPVPCNIPDPLGKPRLRPWMCRPRPCTHILLGLLKLQDQLIHLMPGVCKLLRLLLPARVIRRL